jgi:urease accessory protein
MSLSRLEIPLPLVRLVSAQLPVGAFAYSRGLEHAVHAKWVAHEAALADWIFGTLERSFAPMDGAIFLRMMAALEDGNAERFDQLDALLIAGRESHELWLEDIRMGEAMLQLLNDMEVAAARDAGCKSYAAAFALAVHDTEVEAVKGLAGLFWSVCEAQVAAAIRLGVIGQTGGQRILAQTPDMIADLVQVAQDVTDDRIGNLCFMVAMGSALHEDQYSRLFRS